MTTWHDHQRRWCYGETPMQTLLERVSLANKTQIA